MKKALSHSLPSFYRLLVFSCVIAAGLNPSLRSDAITILSPPVLTGTTNAPLAGLLQLTTDVPSRVSIAVDDGTEGWQRNFHDFGTNHSIPLLGFKPGTTNSITVTVRDRFHNEFTDRKSTRLNSSHGYISYAVFCLKKKNR